MCDDAEAAYPVEAWGFGRRVCPGRPFVESFLWLAIAQMLTVFKIERKMDPYGKEVAPNAEFTPRFIRYAKRGQRSGGESPADTSDIVGHYPSNAGLHCALRKRKL